MLLSCSWNHVLMTVENVLHCLSILVQILVQILISNLNSPRLAHEHSSTASMIHIVGEIRLRYDF